MNFELENMFRFQQIINEMQATSITIANPKIRDQAIKRIDGLLEVYKTFNSYYYSAHFTAQRVLKLEFDNLELHKLLKEKEKEIKKLTATLEWQMK